MSKVKRNQELAQELVRIYGIVNTFTFSDDFIAAMRYQAEQDPQERSAPLIDIWIRKEGDAQHKCLKRLRETSTVSWKISGGKTVERPLGAPLAQLLEQRIRSLFHPKNKERGTGMWALPRVQERMAEPRRAHIFIGLLEREGWDGPMTPKGIEMEMDYMAYQIKALIAAVKMDKSE